MAEPSKFNERADGAAEAIKQKMGIEPSKVEVGPDGRPPPLPPPPGSYMAMMKEQHAAQMAQAAQRETVLQDLPVSETVDQLAPGESPSTPPPNQQTSDVTPEESPNVQKRFQQLTTRLRLAEQERQTAVQQAEELSKSNQELQGRVQVIEQQHKTLLEENLENLDPEVRMQVMQDARMQELLAGAEQRLLQTIMPTVKSLEEANKQRDLAVLSDKYPAFDIELHGELIDMFRKGNPNCTVDQAYRAVAEGDELFMRSQASAPIPPTLAPGGAGNGMPRYVPSPEPDPEAEMVEDAARIRELRASSDPAKQKEGLRLADKNIAQRLAHKFGR